MPEASGSTLSTAKPSDLSAFALFKTASCSIDETTTCVLFTPGTGFASPRIAVLSDSEPPEVKVSSEGAWAPSATAMRLRASSSWLAAARPSV